MWALNGKNFNQIKIFVFKFINVKIGRKRTKITESDKKSVFFAESVTLEQQRLNS